MSFITDREIELLRVEEERYMPSTLTIRGPHAIAEGEVVDGTKATTKGRIRSGFGFFRDVADRLQGITAYTITLPWNTRISVGDKILDEEGNIYEIRDVRDNNSYQTSLKVLGDRIS